MVCRFLYSHYRPLQGSNDSLPPALSEAIVQPAFAKARDASRGGRGEIALQRHQDVRERRLHDPTTGGYAPARRFENIEFPASEWWGEGDVVGNVFQISQRPLA